MEKALKVSIFCHSLHIRLWRDEQGWTLTPEFFLLFLRSISYLWLLAINIYFKWLGFRREYRSPGSSSRVCSCHFRDGPKVNGREIFKRNADKLFPNNETRTPKRTKTKESTLEDDKGLMMVSDIINYDLDAHYQRCTYNNGATLQLFKVWGLANRWMYGTWQLEFLRSLGYHFSKVWGSAHTAPVRWSSAITKNKSTSARSRWYAPANYYCIYSSYD